MTGGEAFLMPLVKSGLLPLGKAVVIGALPDLLELRKRDAGDLVSLARLSLLLLSPLLSKPFLVPAFLVAEDVGLETGIFTVSRRLLLLRYGLPIRSAVRRKSGSLPSITACFRLLRCAGISFCIRAVIRHKGIRRAECGIMVAAAAWAVILDYDRLIIGKGGDSRDFALFSGGCPRSPGRIFCSGIGGQRLLRGRLLR